MFRRTPLCSIPFVLLLAAGCASQGTHTGDASHEEATPIDADAMDTAADPNDMDTAPPPPTSAAQAQQAYKPPAAKPAAAPPPAAQPAASQSVGGSAMPSATTASAPAQPVMAMIEIPAGTVLQLELKTDLSSGTNVPGDEFKSRVLEPITMGGQVMVPERSRIWGTVTEAVSAKQMSGQAHLSLAFEKVELPDGSMHELRATLTQEGVKVGKRTGAVIGGSAAGGALLGKIIGKDTKGAVKGALIGAAIGTGIAASQKGQDLELPSGTLLEIVLEDALRLPEPK